MNRQVLVEAEDRLDRIGRTIYGTEVGGAVEALLDANPGLAALGGMVPAGRLLSVPERVAPAAAAAMRPWL